MGDDDFDNEPSYMFRSLDDVIHFIQWLVEHFDNPVDFEDALASLEITEDTDLEDLLEFVVINRSCTRQVNPEPDFLSCADCGALFATLWGLNVHRTVIHSDKPLLGMPNEEQSGEFWDIINNSYLNHQEEPDDKLHDPD